VPISALRLILAVRSNGRATWAFSMDGWLALSTPGQMPAEVAFLGNHRQLRAAHAACTWRPAVEAHRLSAGSAVIGRCANSLAPKADKWPWGRVVRRDQAADQ
jgi:hypothetical protein